MFEWKMPVVWKSQFKFRQLNGEKVFMFHSQWYTLLVFFKMPPDFEQKFKNPCFYDACHQTNNGTKRKLRCLPFFHVLGVDKCGSTDLYYRIVRHPQILPNSGVLDKETSWWSWRRYGKQLLSQITSPSLSNNSILSRKVEGVDKYQYIILITKTYIYRSLWFSWNICIKRVNGWANNSVASPCSTFLILVFFHVD